MTREERVRLVQEYLAATGSDLYLYSAPIRDPHPDRFRDLIYCKEPKKPRAVVIITTYGGDADSAYRISRALQSCYRTIRVLVVGPCKSAGTLVALGAHEIAFAPTGELGPLDVQMTKPDEIIPLSSGLDIFQALAIVTNHAWQSFEDFLLQITTRSGGTISTKTAAEIASNLITGLFGPITAQIDPVRLGEIQRAISVAKAYGERLQTPNLLPEALQKVVESYPSHGFVIDAQEATRLFKVVSELTNQERQIISFLSHPARHPSDIILDVGAHYSPKEVTAGEDTTSRGVAANSEKDETGVPAGAGTLGPTRAERSREKSPSAAPTQGNGGSGAAPLPGDA